MPLLNLFNYSYTWALNDNPDRSIYLQANDNIGTSLKIPTNTIPDKALLIEPILALSAGVSTKAVATFDYVKLTANINWSLGKLEIFHAFYNLNLAQLWTAWTSPCYWAKQTL